LEGIAGIEKASFPAPPDAPRIRVSSSSPHLGNVRVVYGDSVAFEVSVAGITHTHSDTAAEVVEAKKALEDALKSVGQVDAKDLQVAITANAEPMKFTATISAATRSDWDTTLLQAATSAKGAIRAKHAGSTLSATLPIDVTSKGKSIDIDLVVHNVDFSALTDPQKAAFLKDFVKAVQEGIRNDGGQIETLLGAPRNINADLIDVTVAQELKDAVSVHAKIPTSADDALTNSQQVAVVAELDKLETVSARVQTKLASLTSMAYFSTWTPQAIKVTGPGVAE